MNHLESKKQNIDTGLIKLINKYKEGELEPIKKSGIISYFENISREMKKKSIKDQISDYIEDIFNKTSDLENMNLEIIKKKLSEKYYEAKQIPDSILKESLNSMEKICSSNGFYFKLETFNEKIAKYNARNLNNEF